VHGLSCSEAMVNNNVQVMKFPFFQVRKLTFRVAE